MVITLSVFQVPAWGGKDQGLELDQELNVVGNQEFTQKLDEGLEQVHLNSGVCSSGGGPPSVCPPGPAPGGG